jgi:hypothetical protein
MARLEAANRQMAAELESLRQQTADRPGVPAVPTAVAVSEAPVGSVDPDTIFPLIQGEVGRLMWTKGDCRIVPYGYLWGNTVYATEKTNPGSYTLFVESATTRGESEFVVDGRNTRLGIDVLGPRVPCLGCAQVGGKIEFDFQGAFATTENKGAVLLRHAYAEIKNENFRFLAGQTWDVISPLNPGMLMYSVGWDGGNIGYRRGQVRLERYLAASDSMLLTLQGSINQNVFGDAITDKVGTTTYTLSPEPSGWPIVEGRAAVTLGDRTGPDALPITLGFSGHVGQTEFSMLNGSAIDPNFAKNQVRNTWSFNVDLRVPITHQFGVQCEFFTGENLSPFLGGIGQGLDTAGPATPTLPAGVEPFGEIHSTGGWCEAWYDWTPRLHSHVGYSLDDPNNNDLHAAGERTYNQFFWSNVIYDVTKSFLVGFEVSDWKTQYYSIPTAPATTFAPGESLRCEFVVRYGF